MSWGLGCILYTMLNGIGVWGLNNPIGWGWDITNFVFWVGIGHAGTLISAILFLFRQKWRTGINRSAEAMTIFAVINATTMVLSHTGRQWLFAWLLPTPGNQMQMWTNFRSPLGRVRGEYLFRRFIDVLVYWYGAGLGHRSRCC
jgi:molybdopterin-containing oxidoreductase family membrane subunit